MEKLRAIGLLCRGWDPEAGGIESHTLGIARSLSAAGIRVEVLCTDRNPKRPDYAMGDWSIGGIRVRRMNLSSARPRSLESFDADPRADARVREWLSHVQPDLVHVHHLSGFGFGALAEIERCGLRSIVSLHDYWTLCPRGQMFSATAESCARVEPATCSECIGHTWPDVTATPESVVRRVDRARHALGRAVRLIVPSRAAGEVMRGAGFTDMEFTCVPNGIDGVGLAERVAHLRNGRPAGKRLGVMGAVQPSKGVLELARAMLEIDDDDLVLDVHGPLGDYHGRSAYTEALSDLAGRNGRIHLHGPFCTGDLSRVLASIDALAVPSRWAEVFGLSAREARAVGLPVLAARRAGLAEWEGTSGVTLVTGTSQGEWVRALSSFDFESTAPAALTSVEAMVDQLRAMYDAVLSETVPGPA
ncbi:MAG TPA: glycosyltransferase [Planctomycetes bacterium]|nr:glycosyltransferase [Planctomycetota bacterium]HIK59281.1 glycosyltransferase [Planctomycetota bacterium]